MEYNRGTQAEYDSYEDAARDAAGWTTEEKENGKYDSMKYNTATQAWDIPDTDPDSRTVCLLSCYINPTDSDDYIFGPKQTDGLPVLTQDDLNDELFIWYPES